MSANPSSSGGSVGGGAGSCSSGGGGPCGACKFLRRKCVPGCIFAPYFDSEQGAAHFAAVHKVFGASNVSKLLLHIPVHKRLDAVVTICYEAQARLRDPVYGCVAHIFALQQQVVNLQAELSYLQAHLATLELPSPPPPPPPSTTLMAPPPLSISDLPSATSVPATYDLSSLFDPVVQHSWGMQQRQIDPRQFGGSGSSSLTGSGDLQALARELLHRQGSPQHGCLPCTDASPSQSLSK
ncbi:PREDICTED: LOB domain-containing protein 18 [Theobroma cacao]|uniref:LOB domain-containing protein 18 n=1 Tax=Theobroma cacao TaxID=3641 RepID=A0AB32VV30_THECC|nr:PREDICTED: LOB domain-containing protein 18 [Theobroma cacao]